MGFNANNPTASGMVLTFDDEFNSASDGTSSNGIASGTTFSDHLWWHGSSPNNFSLSNGVLNVYSSLSDAWDGNASTVNSSGQGWTQKFGYFEADIKVSGATGTWPSFWLYSADKVTNPNAVNQEIDIMEGQGTAKDGYFTTLHKNTGNGDQQNTDTWTGSVTQDLSANFHRYGMLWDPNSSEITFYFDGQAVKTVPKYDTTDQSPLQMIVGNGYGDMGGNPVNGSTQDHTDMQVDYVRAYQFANQNPTAVQAETVSAAASQTDPTALANALGQGPSAPAAPAAPSSGQASSTGTTSTSGPNALTLHVSGDMFQGDSQVQILVDGQKVGGTFDVTAHHSQNQWQDITVNGTWDPSTAHQVQVQFVNDGWDGQTANADGSDRNVYVGSITMNGQTIQGQNFASNNASMGSDSIDPHSAVMLANGTVAYDVAAQPATPASGSTSASGGTTTSTGTTSTSGPDALTLHVSGDMFQGDSQIQVLVDGQKVGGTFDVTAHHSQNQWQDITVNGNWDPSTAHQVQVQFVNDAWDGQTGNADGTDRNVYVGSITMNGQTIQGQSFASNNASLGADSLDPHSAVMLANGTVTYAVPAASATTPAPVLMSSSFSDGAGHDVFVFNTPTATGKDIASFDGNADILDLAPALKAAGYTGTDPIADHVITLAQAGTDSTTVKIDPTGHDPSHGTTLVTLDHVLPQDVHAANIWH